MVWVITREDDEMIVLKSMREIEKMKLAGEILADCHKEIAKRIKPEITTMEINSFVESYLKEKGATPKQKDIEIIHMPIV